MHEGVVALAKPIGITLVTAAQIQAALTAFTTVESAFNTARSTKQAASDAFHTAEAAVAAWLGVVRAVLTGHYGSRWSTLWAQAGFINHSTAVPARIAERLALAESVTGFLTLNPAMEVPNLNVTAAYGTTLRNTALTTQQAVMTATVSLGTIGQTWTTAYDTLISVMRDLISNLGRKLSGDDPRWLAFGLQMPATVTTPGKPQNLNASFDELGES
jgi:hypothetical protein